MKALVGFVIISVIALVISLAVYLGAFKGVEISTEERGPYRLATKAHSGAYHKIVPVIEEVERWAVKNDEACQISYGEYIDDPNVVEEDRLRSNGGCVVLKDWTGKMPEGIVYRELPRRLYVIAIFYGAPSIGPQKVYPKVREFMEQQGLVLDAPVIEMYERLPEQKLRTIYHFPARKK